VATRGLPLREPPSAPRVRSTVAEPESSCVATLRRAEDAVTGTRSVMLRHAKRPAARPSRGCRHRYEKMLHANDGNAYGALGPGGGGFLDGDGFLSFLRRYSTEGAPRRIERGQPPTPRPQSRVRPCAPASRAPLRRCGADLCDVARRCHCAQGRRDGAVGGYGNRACPARCAPTA
jgi:hypothetical protein